MAVALIVVVQATGAPKPVAAVCVNTVFIFICHKLSFRTVMTVAATSPILAVITGQLPAAMAPMAIVIIPANLTYVYCYVQCRESTALKRYCVAPVAKALVMMLGGVVIVQSLNWPSSMMNLLVFFGASQVPTGIGGIWGGQYLARRIPLLHQYPS